MVEVHTRVTVIVDLVGSRRHGDRAWVHRVFTQALSAVNDAVPAEQPGVLLCGWVFYSSYLRSKIHVDREFLRAEEP